MSEVLPPESEVLGVRRYMEPKWQARLAHKVSELSGVEPSALPFARLLGGDAYVPVLPEYLYKRALADPDGLLERIGIDQSSRLIEHVIENHSTAPRPLSVHTEETVVRSAGKEESHRMIAWPLKAKPLRKELTYFYGLLVGLNQSPIPRSRPSEQSKLIVAVLPANDYRIDKLADKFEKLRPESVWLLGAQALTATEIKAGSQAGREQARQVS